MNEQVFALKLYDPLGQVFPVFLWIHYRMTVTIHVLSLIGAVIPFVLIDFQIKTWPFYIE